MKDFFYLTVNRNAVVKMNKKDLPQLASGERFLRVDIEVADSFFAPKAIPTVTLKVENPLDAASPVIVLSEVQPDTKGLTETWRAQLKVNQSAARLLEAGLRSSDPETQAEALAILNNLNEQGIKVDIQVPGADDAQ